MSVQMAKKPVNYDARLEVRLSQELLDAAQLCAGCDGFNLSEVVRRLLVQYVEEWRPLPDEVVKGSNGGGNQLKV